jgi:hypothetical protein
VSERYQRRMRKGLNMIKQERALGLKKSALWINAMSRFSWSEWGWCWVSEGKELQSWSVTWSLVLEPRVRSSLSGEKLPERSSQWLHRLLYSGMCRQVVLWVICRTLTPPVSMTPTPFVWHWCLSPVDMLSPLALTLLPLPDIICLFEILIPFLHMTVHSTN